MYSRPPWNVVAIPAWRRYRPKPYNFFTKVHAVSVIAPLNVNGGHLVFISINMYTCFGVITYNINNILWALWLTWISKTTENPWMAAILKTRWPSCNMHFLWCSYRCMQKRSQIQPCTTFRTGVMAKIDKSDGHFESNMATHNTFKWTP